MGSVLIISLAQIGVLGRDFLANQLARTDNGKPEPRDRTHRNVKTNATNKVTLINGKKHSKKPLLREKTDRA